MTNAVGIAAVLQTIVFFYYLRENLILQPYWDMLSHVMNYLQFREGGGWWAYLWEPHVQHRHMWMRLLTAFDVEVFAGVGYPFVVVATACLMVTAGLLWRETRHPLAVMLVLTSVAAVVAATPLNAIYPQTVLFSVLAVVLFDRRPIASTLSAIAAVFSNTVALVLWPILMWMAWRGRCGRRLQIALAVGGALFVAAFVYGLPLEDDTSLAAVPLVERVAFFLTYLGLPWSRSAALAMPGRLLGAALALAGSWAVVHYGWRRPDTGRMTRVAVALMLFSLGSATLAALGRVDPAADVVVPVRYTVLLIPLHAGLLMLALEHGRRLAPAFPAAAAMVAFVLLATSVAAGEAARETTRTMRDTIQRFVNGETSPEMADVVYEDLEEARRESNAIRAAGLYLDVK